MERIDWDGKERSVKRLQDDKDGRLCRRVWWPGQGTRGVIKSSTSLQGQSLQKGVSQGRKARNLHCHGSQRKLGSEL